MTCNRGTTLTVAALVALLFGALTIISGGLALFGGADVQDAAGDAVGFVLWFNFLAGFAYVAAGFGLFFSRHWAVTLSMAILAATAAVFVAFVVHVSQGGAYEIRTVGAMILRTGTWLAIVMVAIRSDLRTRAQSG